MTGRLALTLTAAAAAAAAAFCGSLGAAQTDTLATHAVIMDGDTGEVLFGKGEEEMIPPASMSKLMTAAVVLDLIDRGELSGDTKFAVSEKAWKTGGSKMFVLVDTEIAVRDLLMGLIVVSGNDAAVVLAENIAGSEDAFAELMNARAAAIGLRQSRFSNPTGLDDPGQLMSAADIARLAKYLWDQYPDWRYLFAARQFTWSEITQQNRNPLLTTFEGADGMKTGHTEGAGYSVVGSAERDGVRRIIVTTGLETMQLRSRESYRLMKVAFDDYLTRTFFKPGEIVAEAAVFGGKADSVPLRVDTAVRLTRHRDILAGATAKIRHLDPLIAPIRAGQQVAEMEVTLPDGQSFDIPLYAALAVKEKGVMAKMGQGLRILFTPPEKPLLQ